MAQKLIKQVILRFYEGEEELVHAIESLEGSVVVNDYLKKMLHETLLENDVSHTHATQPMRVDAEALAKELLPQIRKVVEAALASHSISSNAGKGDDALDKNTQEMIQDGLKKLGQSMM